MEKDQEHQQHWMRSGGENSPSQCTTWPLRAASVSRQQQSRWQCLPGGGCDTVLSSNGSSHSERQGKSCGCRCIWVCGRRKKGWCLLLNLTIAQLSLTPWALEDADTCFTNQPVLCLPYDYLVPSCNVPSLCHCYWEDTRNSGQIKHIKSYFLKFVNANCFPC